ncbi:hypothetical protein K438DRAFT_1824382 [Mycena galopus ATCC 62051]|nr:hypothetical protein K438DRAFT_1824382 [Mycena galopus ATCC 62051]
MQLCASGLVLVLVFVSQSESGRPRVDAAFLPLRALASSPTAHRPSSTNRQTRRSRVYTTLPSFLRDAGAHETRQATKRKRKKMQGEHARITTRKWVSISIRRQVARGHEICLCRSPLALNVGPRNAERKARRKAPRRKEETTRTLSPPSSSA